MRILESDIKSKPYHIQNFFNSLDSCLYNPKNRLIHLILKNPSLRKIHPERMKAIITVAKVLIFFTDFRTGNIGELNTKTGEFVHKSVKSIAYYAELDLRRVKRALRDLSITFYYESKKRVTKLSKFIYKSFNSVKKLTDKFFYHLGMKPKTLKKIRAFKEHEHKLKISKKNFYVDEAKFIRNNVFNNCSKNEQKSFTEKIPRNLLNIILCQFST